MRDVLTVLAVAVAVLLVGVLGYSLLFGGEELEALSVQRVEGEVRTERAGESSATAVGDLLGPDDRLVAGTSGRAVLSFGASSALVVESETALRVLGEGDDGIEVELEGGRVHATVRPGDGSLGVRTGERRVSLSEAEADVAFERGATWVQVEDGSAELEGFGDLGRLGAGQRAVATEQGKATVEDIDKDLLLDVSWPGSQQTNAESVTVVGRSSPGARVRIEGGSSVVMAMVDGSGSFEAQVPLGEGGNELVVLAEDPLGRREEASWEVLRDTRPPAVTIQVGGP